MINKHLHVSILNSPQFYTLYADGREDTMIKSETASILLYPENSVLFLYYTYPTHRRVYCVRNCEQSTTELPGLSEKVTVLFKQFASRVDKTKRAVSFLREHYPDNAYSFDDGFYQRLNILLLKKGKLDYYELDELCKRSSLSGCSRYA
jgi:hypothetical protein